MRLLARSYYKPEDKEDAEPDVEWRMTDNNVVMLGELMGDEDGWGDYTVEALGKLSEPIIVHSIRNSVINPKENLYVADDELAELLKKAGVPFKRVENEFDLP